MLKYAITDPRFYGDPGAALARFERFWRADFALFRDKTCADYASAARIFKFELDKAFSNLNDGRSERFKFEYSNGGAGSARDFKFEKKPLFFVQNDVALALSLGADGVHADAAHISNLIFAPRNLIKIASAHNAREIELACAAGADFIVFSPVFASPAKGLPAGLAALKNAVKISSAPVVALGGIISREQIRAVKDCGAVGFAAIRYFTY